MRKGIRKRDMHRLRLGLAGFFGCLRLLLKNRRTHYVLSTYGIGDALMACAYLKAYKTAYNIPHVTLVGKKSKEDIFRMYTDAYDSLMIIGDKRMVRLTNAFLFDFAYHLFYKWKFRITPAVINCHIRNFDMLNKNDNFYYETSTMENLYKSLLYMLPKDVSAMRPDLSRLPDVRDIARSIGIEPGKSVLLFPYANSIQMIDIGFWNALTEQLVKEGFICYTNAAGPKEKPLFGTEIVSLGIAETAAFVQHCGNMVSLRNGMCDITQYVQCKMAVIYSDKDRASTRHFYGLDGMDKPSELIEFNYSASDESKVIEKIVAFIKGGNYEG